ncbi:MAG: DUF4255 domain-containing protein [Bacteroidota bacterium]
MIRQALELVRSELEFYVAQNSASIPEPNTNASVTLGNISLAESEPDRLKNGVVISLVNIEEERTLKNKLSYARSPITGNLEYFNPPVNLNLYLLFTGLNKEGQYEIGLELLSLVLRFFQGRTIFTLNNSVNTSPTEELSSLRLLFSLYTMTFEQLNHLWGSLGGKQLPHVLYRVWLVEERDQRPIQSGEVITEIEGNLSASK